MGKVLRRLRRVGRPGQLALLLAATVGALAATPFLLPADAAPSAVIIDQLVATDPNPGFVENASALLSAAGYRVDVVAGDAVDVRFYQRLPAMGYDVVVVRSHVAAYQVSGGEGSITAFTNEPVRRGVFGQEVVPAGARFVQYDPVYGDATRYYGVTYEFMRDSARGSFDGALVINMGCNGLLNSSLAEGFLRRGASAYIGWDDELTAQETDAATLALLSHLGPDGRLEVGAAVEATMASVRGVVPAGIHLRYAVAGGDPAALAPL